MFPKKKLFQNFMVQQQQTEVLKALLFVGNWFVTESVNNVIELDLGYFPELTQLGFKKANF